MWFRVLWIQIILLSATSFCKYDCRCMDTNPPIKRHFYVDGHELPFLVEESNRTSHQLVSHIFRILLIEVLGYRDVMFIKSDRFSGGDAVSHITHSLQKITQCERPRNCSRTVSMWPEVMLNLELWLTPAFQLDQWTKYGDLEDCGPLGPVGMSGWFVPTYSVQELWSSNRTILDHWRAFHDPHIASMFDLIDGSDNTLNSFGILKNDRHCTDEQCDEAVFRPMYCKEATVRCATLLVDYPESTFHLLKEDITRSGLLVNIFWVGDNLQEMVTNRLHQRKPVLFYHIKPSFLFSSDSFTRIPLPCEGKTVFNCGYQFYQMQKVAWRGIKQNAPVAFHLLKSMAFSPVEYNNLLDEYHSKFLDGFTVEHVACEWVRSKSFIWSKWLVDSLHRKKPLYIGGIFPLSGVYWKQSGIAEAASMAITAVNRNSSVLPGYQLILLKQDGQCVTDEVIKCFISYVLNSTFQSMIGILGPACTDTVEPIAGIAKYFNTIIMSYSAGGSLFSSTEKYSYFFRTVPKSSQFRFVYLKLFQRLQWNRIAFLTDQGKDYSEYVSGLHDLFQLHGINFISSHKLPTEKTILDISIHLEYLKNQNARIIIGEFYDHTARIVMCIAYQMGMTAAQGYQWFLPIWFNSDWYDTDTKTDTVLHSMEKVPCSTAEMEDAIHGHLSLGFKSYGDKEDQMQENRPISEWMQDYKKLAKIQKVEVSQYGGYAYDAVWAYALALHKLLEDNNSHVATLHKPKTSRHFAEMLNGTEFKGVSGPLKLTDSGRLSDVIIWQWLRKKKKLQVGAYRPFSLTDGHLKLDESRLLWVTSTAQRPHDGNMGSENCPLEIFNKALSVSCEVGTGILVVLFFLLVLALLIFGVMFLRRRYEKAIRRTQDRLKELGLVENSRLLLLDEWEMRREHVVMNRKLGEGAFGTVYGGEAFVQNTGWTSVAVKTLKVGAKLEEKLDFLSEVELMTRLSHENIIQMIGVCMAKEPMYLVMEFMLYGDLKTYLLARRNLAMEQDRSENDEVSDMRLTKMALDVACGLSYLAQSKYVHRDLACRNCLVGKNRIVKIGDFGLCRPLQEAEYYRFSRTGMLPIRWMAPENIGDGLFTPMSDIWSYGIVLFEIITFGNFPYQCLSNDEVVKYVNNCSILNLPVGCDPKLEGLLKECWSVVPQNRPSALEIVQLLANNPYLVSPCLDEPAASVELEDSFRVPHHEPLSWLWQQHNTSSSTWHSQPSPYAAANCFSSSANNYDTKQGIEMKSNYMLNISQSSYLDMAPSKNKTKVEDNDEYCLSTFTQVTHL